MHIKDVIGSVIIGIVVLVLVVLMAEHGFVTRSQVEASVLGPKSQGLKPWGNR